MATVVPLWPRRLSASQTRFPVVASEPWGRLERLADGIWALVSTPLEDGATLCNGGIVVGRAGVVVVEAFGSDAGATWMFEQATRLAGRRPTHVVLTHYHSDHTAGLRGVAPDEGVKVLATDTTRNLTEERNQEARRGILDRVVLLDGRRPTEIDLGNRSLIVVPRRGHTASDITIEVPDTSVVFCGDLVWNAMFPNYVDASPTRLTREVQLLRAQAASVYVPGHGPLAEVSDLDAYLGLLDDVERAAREALARGMTAEEAGSTYRLPAGLEDWTLFSPGYFARAIGKWMEELQG
jgi:glyoxylase-like metal-dependent hydrolase (beta-lactamase superfamily II)